MVSIVDTATKRIAQRAGYVVTVDNCRSIRGVGETEDAARQCVIKNFGADFDFKADGVDLIPASRGLLDQVNAEGSKICFIVVDGMAVTGTEGMQIGAVKTIGDLTDAAIALIKAAMENNLSNGGMWSDWGIYSKEVADNLSEKYNMKISDEDAASVSRAVNELVWLEYNLGIKQSAANDLARIITATEPTS